MQKKKNGRVIIIPFDDVEQLTKPTHDLMDVCMRIFCVCSNPLSNVGRKPNLTFELFQ